MTAQPPARGTGVAKKSEKKKPKKKRKQDGKPAQSDAPSAAGREAPAKPRPSRAAKVTKAVKKARVAASKIRDNPVVLEIVAAALVATAAALRDPQKARRIAAEAGDELKRAGSKAGRKADAFWNLALDIARRSVDALDAGEAAGASSPKAKSKK